MAEERVRGAGMPRRVSACRGRRDPFARRSATPFWDIHPLHPSRCSAGASRNGPGFSKAGGELVFTEHGLAPDVNVGGAERLNPIWSAFGGGCNLNRPIPFLLEQGGFRSARDFLDVSTGVEDPRVSTTGTRSAK